MAMDTPTGVAREVVETTGSIAAFKDIPDGRLPVVAYNLYGHLLFNTAKSAFYPFFMCS